MTATQAPRGRPLGRRVLRWLGRGLAAGFALLVLGALAVVVVIPRATHAAALTVLTGSMSPGIPVGSIVLVRPADPQTLRVGDVATYQAEPDKPAYITHRIVKVNDATTPPTFVFKGDANRGVDTSPVSAGAIRGKVWFHVPYLGAIRDGLHGRGGLSLVAILVLAGYAISQLNGALEDRRKAKAGLGAGSGTDPGDTEADSRLVGETLVLATFDTAEAARRGQSPQVAAADWKALLLGVDGDRFRLLIAPPPDGVAATVELAQSHGCLSAVVIPGPVRLVGTTSGGVNAPPSCRSSAGPITVPDHPDGDHAGA